MRRENLRDAKRISLRSREFHHCKKQPFFGQNVSPFFRTGKKRASSWHNSLENIDVFPESHFYHDLQSWNNCCWKKISTCDEIDIDFTNKHASSQEKRLKRPPNPTDGTYICTSPKITFKTLTQNKAHGTYICIRFIKHRRKHND